MNNLFSMNGWSSDPALCGNCRWTFEPPSKLGLMAYGTGHKKVGAVDGYLCDLCLNGTYPRPPSIDKCVYCRTVELNLGKECWLYASRWSGVSDNVEFTKCPVDKLDTVAEWVKPIEEYRQEIPRPFEIARKPSGRWFSAGSWLYDKCMGDIHNCQNIQGTKMGNKVYAIVKPENILCVNNRKDFYSFYEKYHHEDCSNNEAIDWESVARDGYYGVSFPFCSVSALGIYNEAPDVDYKLHSWHSGYDVESLVVWDYRAYDRKLYPVELYWPSNGKIA